MNRIKELFQIFYPLLLLYLAAFFVTYTSLGAIIGIKMPVEMLYLKIGIVITISLLAIVFTYRRINDLSESKLIRVLSKSVLITMSIFLFLITPLIAESLGVRY